MCPERKRGKGGCLPCTQCGWFCLDMSPAVSKMLGAWTESTHLSESESKNIVYKPMQRLPHSATLYVQCIYYCKGLYSENCQVCSSEIERIFQCFKNVFTFNFSSPTLNALPAVAIVSK